MKEKRKQRTYENGKAEIDAPLGPPQGFHEIRLPQPPGTRIPTTKMDYGDEATIGLHLKRHGDYFSHPEGFGVYMGQREGLWRVAIKSSTFPPTITRLATYDSLEAVKADWQLD